MSYKPRVADSLLNLKLESFGAALIKGPKGCGKTTTAKGILAELVSDGSVIAEGAGRGTRYVRAQP